MNHLILGILAHVDAGKTTLSEGLLYTGGSIRKIGRVDNHDAFLDTYDLEKKRGITIFSKQAIIQRDDLEITLLDTPGHVDFSAEMERTLQVLDAAILVISATDGVQGHTRTLWKLLQKYQLPVYIFVNKMDQPGCEKEQILRRLHTELGQECVDFTDITASDFHETIAMSDEAILNDFLEGKTITDDDIREKISERKIFPCVFGSALNMEGVDVLLDTIERFYNRPSYPDTFGARVYKIARDEQGNRLTYLKVTGGSLKVKDILTGGENEEAFTEKINQIRLYSGQKYEAVNEVNKGSVCAVTGLTKTRPGMGLGIETDGAQPVLEPVLSFQVILPDDCDALPMLQKLRQLEEEEPELHIIWDETHQEIHAQLMGAVQIEVLQHMIEERYGVKVTFGAGSIVYKETIGAPTRGVGHFEPLRHYAEVHLLMEPLEPGSGIVVATDCSEDVLDKNWQRLICTHIEEREHPGVLVGAPITDMKITLIGGRAHVKHTEGGDFRQATYRAIRQGLMKAEPVLLEPFYSYTLSIPESVVGRAMTDMEKMNGTFTLESNADTVLGERMAVLTGRAPVSTMQEYGIELAAYSKGMGRLTCEYLGYYPCHNTEEVVERIGYDPEADFYNTPDSVFCMHGSGTVVPWYEVEQYMHVDPGKTPLSEEEQLARMKEQAVRKKEVSEFIDIEEIDAIMKRTFFTNKKENFIPHKGINRKNAGHSKAPARNDSVTREYKPTVQREKYLLVDGYNVIFAWDELKELAAVNIDGARGKLQDILCSYQAVKHVNLILVFDAYKIEGHKIEYMDYQNIHIVYTAQAQTADQYIEHFAHENGKKYDITVATSDGLEQIIIRGQGCHLLSSRELETEIHDTLVEFRRSYLETEQKKKDTGKQYLLDQLTEDELNQLKAKSEE